MNEQLETRLRAQFKACDKTHRQRARRYGVPSSLDFDDLLENCRAFNWCCATCGKDLAQVEHWHLAHFNFGIQNSAHTQLSCAVLCASCNIRLGHYGDNVDRYLVEALKRDPVDFWDRLKRAYRVRNQQADQQLAELDSQLSLAESALLTLAEMVRNGRDY